MAKIMNLNKDAFDIVYSRIEQAPDIQDYKAQYGYYKRKYQFYREMNNKITRKNKLFKKYQNHSNSYNHDIDEILLKDGWTSIKIGEHTKELLEAILSNPMAHLSKYWSDILKLQIKNKTIDELIRYLVLEVRFNRTAINQRFAGDTKTSTAFLGHYYVQFYATYCHDIVYSHLDKAIEKSNKSGNSTSISIQKSTRELLIKIKNQYFLKNYEQAILLMIEMANNGLYEKYMIKMVSAPIKEINKIEVEFFTKELQRKQTKDKWYNNDFTKIEIFIQEYLMALKFEPCFK